MTAPVFSFIIDSNHDFLNVKGAAHCLICCIYRSDRVYYNHIPSMQNLTVSVTLRI